MILADPVVVNGVITSELRNPSKCMPLPSDPRSDIESLHELCQVNLASNGLTKSELLYPRIDPNLLPLAVEDALDIVTDFTEERKKFIDLFGGWLGTYRQFCNFIYIFNCFGQKYGQKYAIIFDKEQIGDTAFFGCPCQQCYWHYCH